jgi:hypothetical protein
MRGNRDLTLVSNGFTPSIEPYGLMIKTDADGGEEESLHLFNTNGGLFPNKYFRVDDAGNLQFLDDQFTDAQWTLSDKGIMGQKGVDFGDLPIPVPGKVIWCPDCNVATPCTGVGSGAWAFATVGPQWTCPF